MYKFLILFCISLPCSTFTQNNVDFTEIDRYARETPSSKTSEIAELSAYLTAVAKNDIEKVRAIYVWIAENIRYDTKLYFDDKISPRERTEKQTSQKVLKYKKGVCEGYSNLFQDLAQEAGLVSEKVSGFTKNQRGRVARLGHAWNAVRIENEWYLIDNTWGAGYVDNENNRFKRQFEEKYFLADPEVFVLDHYPNDPLFQMLPNPIKWEVFQEEEDLIRKYLRSEHTPTFQNFTDSLNYYTSLQGNEKIINSSARTLKFDPQNGYANYLIANSHYDKSKESFELYREETSEIVHTPKKITSTHLSRWSKYISASEKHLKIARQYLDKIEPGNKFYKSSRAAKKNVTAAMSNIRSAKQQMSAFKDYLKRR
jgi:hypothetical protein